VISPLLPQFYNLYTSFYYETLKPCSSTFDVKLE